MGDEDKPSEDTKPAEGGDTKPEGDTKPAEGGDAKPEIKDVVTIAGQELKTADVEDALKRLSNAESFYNNLISQGVLDTSGNVVKKEETSEEIKDETADEKIAKLEKDIQIMSTKADSKEVITKVNQLLSKASRIHDLTKDDEDAATLTENLAVAAYYMQPNSDVATLHKNAADVIQKIVNKKVKSYVEKKADSPRTEAAGGSSVFATDKPPTRDDLKSGAVRKMFEAGMTKLAEIG
jgi:hypothetical protein